MFAFFTGIWNNPASRWIAGIALAIVGISVIRRDAVNDYKRTAEIKGRKKIRKIERDLDERIERAESNAADLPEYSSASELPDHLRAILDRGNEPDDG